MGKTWGGEPAVSLDYCGRALGARQRLPESSPPATFESTLGRIGQRLPRVYCPGFTAAFFVAVGLWDFFWPAAASGLYGATWPAWQQDVWLPLLVRCILTFSYRRPFRLVKIARRFQTQLFLQ